MHGLVNRAIEMFARTTYSDAFWDAVVRDAGIGLTSFEPMMLYDHDVTRKALGALSVATKKPRPELLEDIGTFLVTTPNWDGLRRLLRFGGDDFVEFLYSLDDLQARARLAVPDLGMPHLELREYTRQSYNVCVRSDPHLKPYSGYVVLGVLRAMADDYGALALLDHKPAAHGHSDIQITLLETAFAQARDFELGARPA